MIVGFYVVSSTYYKINVIGFYSSSTKYEINVITTSDCVVYRVDLYVVIFQENGMNTKYYYVIGENVVGSNSTLVNSASWTATVSSYDKTYLLMGIRGFEGFTALSNI